MNGTRTLAPILAALAGGFITGFYYRKLRLRVASNVDNTECAEQRESKRSEEPVSLLIKAMDYSTEKHKDQKRKNSLGHPYICHPVRVARRLLVDGGVDDVLTLAAALLHDTVEDTDATLEEIEQLFGSEVAHLVHEVSDDKSLPKQVRKQKQIQHAPLISPKAKAIKLADKLDNLSELVEIAPIGWDQERVRNYFDWAEAVVKGLRGVNSALEEQLDDVFLKKEVAAKKACNAP